MTTKVKGLLKGLRYISQIFEDEKKEPEMEIGFPTDVKHVAHIGWDGPSVDSPSWMKDFTATGPGGGTHSAPLSNGDNKDVSEDETLNLEGGSRPLDLPGLSELPKSTRRIPSAESSSGGGTSSPRKEKSRHSRRHHSKDSSESAKSSRQIHLQEGGGGGSHSPSKSLPDLPKKSSRRKKSKESVNEGSSRSSRKGKSSQNSDLQDFESSVRSNGSEYSQTSSSSKGARREESSGLS